MYNATVLANNMHLLVLSMFVPIVLLLSVAYLRKHVFNTNTSTFSDTFAVLFTADLVALAGVGLKTMPNPDKQAVIISLTVLIVLELFGLFYAMNHEKQLSQYIFWQRVDYQGLEFPGDSSIDARNYEDLSPSILRTVFTILMVSVFIVGNSALALLGVAL